MNSIHIKKIQELKNHEKMFDVFMSLRCYLFDEKNAERKNAKMKLLLKSASISLIHRECIFFREKMIFTASFGSLALSQF